MVAATAQPAGDTKLLEDLVELIRISSTRLPPDVVAALDAAQRTEPVAQARSVLLKMVKNQQEAYARRSPTCQDTGTLIFEVDYGPAWRESQLHALVLAAVRQATAAGYLRANTVDSVTGKNITDNVYAGAPYVHFHQKDVPGLTVRIMQKGGGCENVGAQYSLPDERLGAGRDLEGVRRCILDAVVAAQGRGCAPGSVGVCIGGDRGQGYLESKKQFWRRLDDVNADATLAALEKRVLEEANTLGIGPMGFGGGTTLIGCKVGTLARLPASFFVTVSYMCWAFRRATLNVAADGTSTLSQ
jgi:fumarate hydratase class I